MTNICILMGNEKWQELGYSKLIMNNQVYEHKLGNEILIYKIQINDQNFKNIRYINSNKNSKFL